MALVKNRNGSFENTQHLQRTNPYEQGTRYYDLYEANPWTEDKRTRQKTWWDQLSNFFGFRSGYDLYTDQANQAMAEEDARIAALKGEDEYNSEAAKAARMKVAGENPDLLGTGGVATAAESDQPITPPEIQPDEALGKVEQFMSSLPQIMLSALGMTNEIGKAIQTFQTIEGTNIDLQTKYETLAGNFLNWWTPDEGELDNYLKMTGKEKNEENLNLFMEEAAYRWAKQRNWNKSQANKFAESVSMQFGSNKALYYNKWRENEEARQKWGTERGSQYNTFDKEWEEIIECLKPFSEYYDKYRKASASANAEDAENKEEYNKTWDANQAAKTENAANTREEQQAQLDENMKKAFNEVMSKLTAKAEKGDKWAWMLTLLLPPIYEHLMSGSVNVARQKNGSYAVKELSL